MSDLIERQKVLDAICELPIKNKFTTNTNVRNKETVIIEPLIITYGGYCKCGNLVNTDYQYCPKCGARLEWK